MKAQFAGMGSHQGLPTAQSYLVISYLDRLEDGEGDASVAQYFAVYHPGTDTWRDAHNPSAPLLLPVNLTRTTRIEITEVFQYADRPEVRTVFGGWATATNLDGTQIDYTQLRPTPLAPGADPLTMQAARELISSGTTLIAEADERLAALVAIPTAVKGLRVEDPTAAPAGGQLYAFVADASAITPATISASPNGGLLYTFSGGL